jgi:hypothetical protein
MNFRSYSRYIFITTLANQAFHASTYWFRSPLCRGEVRQDPFAKIFFATPLLKIFIIFRLFLSLPLSFFSSFLLVLISLLPRHQLDADSLPYRVLLYPFVNSPKSILDRLLAAYPELQVPFLISIPLSLNQYISSLSLFYSCSPQSSQTLSSSSETHSISIFKFLSFREILFTLVHTLRQYYYFILLISKSLGVSPDLSNVNIFLFSLSATSTFFQVYLSNIVLFFVLKYSIKSRSYVSSLEANALDYILLEASKSCDSSFFLYQICSYTPLHTKHFHFSRLIRSSSHRLNLVPSSSNSLFRRQFEFFYSTYSLQCKLKFLQSCDYFNRATFKWPCHSPKIVLGLEGLQPSSIMLFNLIFYLLRLKFVLKSLPNIILCPHPTVPTPFLPLLILALLCDLSYIKSSDLPTLLNSNTDITFVYFTSSIAALLPENLYSRIIRFSHNSSYYSLNDPFFCLLKYYPC